jgi:hypothetical protein
MSRQFGIGLTAIAAMGLSLALVSPANAFHGGSNGSHGGFFGGSHGSNGGSSGGSFGGLFHHHHGSSGGSHGGSNSCACECGDDEATEANHEDADNHGDHADRAMDAPSRESVRESRDVNVYDRDRDGRRHDSRVNHDSSKDRDDKNVDRDRGNEKKDKDMKKDEDKDKKEEAKK